jgi:hypothetical protein
MKSCNALGLGSLVVVLGACSSASSPADGTAAHNSQAARLVAGQWRLYSAAFSMQRSDGFPIAFQKSGEVDTKNLVTVTNWALTREGLLELRTRFDDVAYALQYDEANGLYFKRDFPWKGHVMLIFPAGFDFSAYRPPAGQ